MKANELRIGNLFKDKLTDEMLICCGISCDTDGKNSKIEFSVLNREKYPLPNGWKALPIKISGKWLSMLGFISVHGGKLHIDNHPEYYIYGSNEFYINGVKNGFKYVHQLQNLFYALVGEELTIKENPNDDNRHPKEADNNQ